MIGFDVDRERVGALSRGASPLLHLPAGLAARLAASGRFEATCDLEREAELDVALIAVPTPLDARGEPDLGRVAAAGEALGRSLRDGALCVLESTSWPGTTRDLLAPRLRARGRSHRVAYSPEREDPGGGRRTTAIPKLVGGTCARSGDVAEALYRAAFERVVRVSSAEVAEAAKLHENTFRAVNIALANELEEVLRALGIDAREVLAAAATKPFGYLGFEPGPGAGGGCIPVDPVYLARVARRHGAAATLAERAIEVNAARPARVVERVRARLALRGVALAGSRVLVLGLAYKRDVDLVELSPSIRVLELLEDAGARADYADPHVPRAPAAAGPRIAGRAAVALDADSLAAYDAVVVATDHAAFDWDLVRRHAREVVDTRGALARPPAT